jgi:hypothetical protein
MVYILKKHIHFTHFLYISNSSISFSSLLYLYDQQNSWYFYIYNPENVFILF